MNRVGAMRDADIRAVAVDIDEMTIRFENGLVLPIQCFLDADGVLVEDPVDHGWAEFGNDEAGYGSYRVRMITDEEYYAALEAGPRKRRGMN